MAIANVEAQGVYRLLAETPAWAIAAGLLLFGDIAVYLCRDFFEGLGYQVSYAAKIGDAAVFIGIMIGAALLVKGATKVPKPLSKVGKQLSLVIGALLVGAVFCAIKMAVGLHSWQVADVYHDVFLVPVLIVLVILLIPIITLNGSNLEKIAVVLCGLTWTSTFTVDLVSERLNQRKWLATHNIILPPAR